MLLSGSRTRAKRLAQDLQGEDLTAFYSEDPFREIQPGEVMTFYGRVLKGFEYPLIKFVVISESDIFGLEKKKKKKEGTKWSFGKAFEKTFSKISNEIFSDDDMK